MWARVCEAMFGCWLAMSPFIFAHSPRDPLQWWNDFVCAVLVIFFALASFHRRTRWAHLLSLAVGCWLIGIAYSNYPRIPSPALQNDLLVGLFLLMFAIIPNHAHQPPSGWVECLQRAQAENGNQSEG